VSLLAELKPRVFITTHFLKFAQTLAAENTDDSPLRFLRVELDDNDQPTFQFLSGVATTSLAHLTAARLGVTREELLGLIRKNSRQTK
jgi:DNA mismatch repair protein MutS2